MDMGLIVVAALVLLAVIILAKTAVVVPQQRQYVVERLGKYAGTLDAGFHILVPFIDSIRYRHSLKESALDIPEQICITSDNVQVGVDGVLYLKVLDAQRASYGIGDYMFAITQLAQTTLRSEIGKIELDKTFEERAHINNQIVDELDKATEPWGVKVLPLRDQEHQSSPRRARGHGEADARRARKACHDSGIGRPPGFGYQHGRGREAESHQRIRGDKAATNQ